MATKTDSEFTVTDHVLVPKHEKCSEKEKRAVLAEYKVEPGQLPRILMSDPAIQHLGCEDGDLIKITRQSTTAGKTVFYRIVTME